MTGFGRHLTDVEARRLVIGSDPYLSCDDCFGVMDACVDAVLGTAAPAGDAVEGAASSGLPDSLPLLRVHVAACPACAEEVESLLMLVAAQDGIDPDPARRALGLAS
jgi:hypothetical protein